MIWAQAGACFVVWIAYGVWLRGRSEWLRRRLSQLGRSARALLGAGALVMGAAGLLAGLVGISSFGGLQKGTMTPLGWAAATLLGLGFIHLQVLGAASMISLAQESETGAPAPPSDGRE